MPRPLKDLKGQKIGRWTVIEWAGQNRFGHSVWLCACACGNVKIVAHGSLMRGISLSCGCTAVEAAKKRAIHGESNRTALYRAWQHMLRRCYLPTEINYSNYGGRGIVVCDRWHTYMNFRDDMGPHPGQPYSLDRIDNNGNYEPGNCRWATRSEQSSNQQHRFCEICGRESPSGAGLSLHMRKAHPAEYVSHAER